MWLDRRGRGERFYGRQSHLQEILAGPRESLWLLGTRSIGKTSLLRQLEWTAYRRPDLGYVPPFWDLQGTDDPAELHLSFHDALLDSEERWSELGIEVATLDPADLFASLTRLRRQIRTTGRRHGRSLLRRGLSDAQRLRPDRLVTSKRPSSLLCRGQS